MIYYKLIKTTIDILMLKTVKKDVIIDYYCLLD